jgi:AraC family transcriptional regulator
MRLEQSSTIDYRRQDDISKILPSQPLTSRRSAWHGIEVQSHRQPPGEMPEHWTDQHILAIQQPGQQSLFCEHWMDGKKQVAMMGAGDFAIVPANITHRCTWNVTAAATVLVLEPQYLTHVAYESIRVDRVELLPRFFQFDPVLQQISGLLAREIQSETNSQIYVDGLTTALSAHLVREYCTVKPVLNNYENGLSQRKLQQSIDYIQAHLSGDISLDDVAIITGMSRYYFCHLFKRSTGMSPYQYVIKCRIDRAKELLLFRQDCSIADVAFQVGFGSQSQFTKYFKKWVGTTPKKF